MFLGARTTVGSMAPVPSSSIETTDFLNVIFMFMGWVTHVPIMHEVVREQLLGVESLLPHSGGRA